MLDLEVVLRTVGRTDHLHLEVEGAIQGGKILVQHGVATRLARPLTSARDPMSGFFALRKADFDRAEALNPVGYKIALELIVKCDIENVAEVPIHFADRIHGESKLTFKEQHELDNIPDRITALETAKSELEKVLADPQMFARDREGYETAAKKLAEVEQAISTSEDRWLALDEMQEAITNKAAS